MLGVANSGSSGSLRFGYVYITLAFIRLFCALYGTGYIHPDEHFQSGEVVAGKQLGLHVLTTWEWEPVLPCRSMFSIGPSAIAYLFLRGLSTFWTVTPRLLFVAERLVFCALSFILDATVYYNIPENEFRERGLILLASSYITNTYQVRPFSNASEAILLALSLWMVRNLAICEKKVLKMKLRFLAQLLVFGIFTRLTFAAFFLPIAVEAFKATWSQTTRSYLGASWVSLMPHWLQLVLIPLVWFAVDVAWLVAIDTAMNGGTLLNPIITPLNFWHYNMSPENLAEHGLHPRWLHIVVNVPMLLGPNLLYYGVRAAFDVISSASHEVARDLKPEVKKDKPLQNPQNPPNAQAEDAEQLQVCLSVILVSLAILSAAPHQEPRFLIPLLVPFILLVAQSDRFRRASTPFWTLWIVFNLCMTMLFGFWHQGGVVPSLFRLHHRIDHLRTTVPDVDTIHVVYWKTYMPPRRLLALPQRDVDEGTYTVVDLAGSPVDDIWMHFDDLRTTSRTYLVAPQHAIYSVDDLRISCCVLVDTVFPHLDLDHLPEAMELGWKDGLTLGIFEVDSHCVWALEDVSNL